MIILKIKGYDSHLFREDSGCFIDYERSNKSTLNRKSKSFIKRVSNSYSIRIHIEGISSAKRNINKQKYENFFKEDKSINIKPYLDKSNEYIEIPVNTSMYTKNIGKFDGNESQLKVDSNYFVDRHKFTTSDFVDLDETQIENYTYPIRFNSTDFYRRGSRIEVFDSIKRIQEYNYGVDNAKGIKGSSLSHGVNGIKENVQIRNFIIKNQEANSFFEDGILEDIIYNANEKSILINDPSDPSKLIKEKVNKISNEPRYVKFNSQKIDPYKDVVIAKRSELVKNDSNFFYNRLRDENMNNILSDNRSKNQVIHFEEEKIHASLGKSIDYSFNSGVESIFYYESLD